MCRWLISMHPCQGGGLVMKRWICSLCVMAPPLESLHLRALSPWSFAWNAWPVSIFSSDYAPGQLNNKKKTYRNVDSVCKNKRIMSFSIEIFKQLSDGKTMTLQEPEVNEMSGIISCTWIQFLDVTFFHLQRIWSEEKWLTYRKSNLLQCWCKQTTGYSSFLCSCLIYISNLILCSGCSCQCTLDSVRKGRETGFIARRLNR